LPKSPSFVYSVCICISLDLNQRFSSSSGLICTCCWRLASKHGTLSLLYSFAGEMLCHPCLLLFSLASPCASVVGLLDLSRDVVVSPFHFQPLVGLPLSRALSFHLADLHQVLGCEIVDPTCGALDHLVFVLPCRCRRGLELTLG
jgi:hypothetical protein